MLTVCFLFLVAKFTQCFMLSSFTCSSQLPVGVLIQLVGMECIPELLSDHYHLPGTSEYLEDLFSSAIIGMADLKFLFDVIITDMYLYYAQLHGMTLCFSLQQ